MIGDHRQDNLMYIVVAGACTYFLYWYSPVRTRVHICYDPVFLFLPKMQTTPSFIHNYNIYAEYDGTRTPNTAQCIPRAVRTGFPTPEPVIYIYIYPSEV